MRSLIEKQKRTQGQTFFLISNPGGIRWRVAEFPGEIRWRRWIPPGIRWRRWISKAYYGDTCKKRRFENLKSEHSQKQHSSLYRLLVLSFPFIIFDTSILSLPFYYMSFFLPEVCGAMACPICLAVVDNEPTFLWGCGHSAHIRCMRLHFTRSMPCPVCRHVGFASDVASFRQQADNLPPSTEAEFVGPRDDSDYEELIGPLVPRSVLPLCCNRVMATLEQGEVEFHTTADRRMHWVPSRLFNGAWLQQWVCLQCNMSVAPSDPIMQVPRDRPDCLMHNIRDMLVDLDNGERSWCCTQYRNGEITILWCAHQFIDVVDVDMQIISETMHISSDESEVGQQTQPLDLEDLWQEIAPIVESGWHQSWSSWRARFLNACNTFRFWWSFV